MMEVIEQISTEDARRALIVQRRDGMFRVQVLRFIEEDLPGFDAKAKLWVRMPGTIALTDRLDRARTVAAAALEESQCHDIWPC